MLREQKIKGNYKKLFLFCHKKKPLTPPLGGAIVTVSGLMDPTVALYEAAFRGFLYPLRCVYTGHQLITGGDSKGLFFLGDEMTVKEIAQAVGKDERSVARWVSSLSDKMTEISDKVSKAKATSKAANYSLFETCAIIEEGMGKAAADIYRSNAEQEQKPKKITPYSAAFIREVRLTLGKEAAAALLTGLPIKAKKPLEIEAPKALPAEIARQVYAVAYKAIERYNREQRVKAISPSLFEQATKEAGK